MTYNLLRYPGTNVSARNPYFYTVISNANPDILVVQEISTADGVNILLNNVLRLIDTSFKAGTFIDGTDTDNAIFYKSTYFSFIDNTPISTPGRDINQFKLYHKTTLDTLIIYSVHLKASTGTANEQQRLAEVTALRNVTDQLPPNTNYIVLGDFNIYRSTEPAYQKLVDTTSSGYFIDIFNLPGTWNSSAYAIHHTQSTRTRDFSGGATGGLDDRFDMILFSPAALYPGGISYVPNSYIPYGNDGLHYNDSINRPPNLAVGQIIADALHYASDHLPVLATLYFDIPSSAYDSFNISNNNSSQNIIEPISSFQSYPNPFNSQSNISFYLNEKNFITLKIFNILGQEIKTLINSELDPGYHSINFSLDNPTNGAATCGSAIHSGSLQSSRNSSAIYFAIIFISTANHSSNNSYHKTYALKLIHLK